MILECPKCKKKYKIDEEKYFKGKEEISLKCPHCQEIIKARKDEQKKIIATETQRFKKPEVLADDLIDIPDAHLLAMPSNVRISVAVISGNDAGNVFPIEKPVVVIGRTGCDIVLNDPEVSRRHARIEIRDENFILRDLKSTNGTYINERHIQTAPLENRTEFRLGSTVLMFLITKDLF